MAPRLSTSVREGPCQFFSVVLEFCLGAVYFSFIMIHKKKLLVITGPTATGKTALGLKLAEKLNGEIISADSRQVYKYMDIGTGKDTDHFQWGIDLVMPDQQYNVSDWVNYTIRVIRDIWGRRKLPIIVGGTGQYIKELLYPSETLHIPPNKELRKELAGFSLEQLQQELIGIDRNKWELMNSSDRQNPRRLIRAIEVAMYVNRNGRGIQLTTQIGKVDGLIVGLTAPLEYLYAGIDQRVKQRLVAGMEQERERLKKYPLPKTIGYSGETEEQWRLAEHAYARRQLVYLRRQIPRISWFDITAPGYPADVVTRICRWYSGNDGSQKN